MKAFIIDRYGKKDGVRIGEMPEPELRDDDVLVQIHAASINPAGSQDQRRKAQTHFALSLAAHSGQ